MTEAVSTGRQWAKDILSWYQEGMFDVEVAAKLEIPIKEFYRQMQESAAFGRLVEYGRTLCEAYWVSKARTNLNNKSFNTTPWMFVMKNQFNWADKTEQVSEGSASTMNLDELRQRINKDVARFIKQHSPELTDVKKAMEIAASNE